MRCLLFALVTSLSMLPAAFAQSSITASQILSDIRTLADPSWEGRGAGTKGLDSAADFIAKRMKDLGLSPAGTDGYFFPFEVITDISLTGDNTLSDPSGSLWRAPHDFNPLVSSENGAVEGEVVFVGYGLSIPEKSRDDYAGLDVKGKIVVITRGLPEDLRGQKEIESKSALRYKTYLAREKGAKAVIFISKAPEKGEPSDDPLIRLKPDGNSIGGAGIIVVHARQSLVRGWLVTPGMNPTGPEAFKPRATGVTIKLNVQIAAKKAPAKNVIGLIKGSDPTLSAELVVIGAHYDHLGYGGAGSLAPDLTGTAHVGADDNASGTAALLAIARAISEMKTKPARSIIFCAFAGEELGLLGSAAFTEKPTFPTAQMTAMLNMDMVGRLKDNNLAVIGTQTAKEWEAIVTAANTETKLKLSMSGDGYGPSDQTSFYLKKIPVLHFFTGAHEDYHKPSDTWDKINSEGEAKIAKLVMNVALALATVDKRMAVIEIAAPSASGDSRGYGASLGTIPDMTGSTAGVKISGVKAGGPAEAAGLIAGDIILSLDGKKLASLQDMTYVLRELKPGQEIEIVYLRDGKEKKTSAKLGKR
jgi:aminopeptidase YwaD